MARKNKGKTLTALMLRQATQSNVTPSTLSPLEEAPSKASTGPKSQIAYDCNLSDKLDCTTVNGTAFVCTTILADYINLDNKLFVETNEQLVRYFTTVGISSDNTLKLFAGKTWPTPRTVVPAHEGRVDLLSSAAMLALDQVS